MNLRKMIALFAVLTVVSGTAFAPPPVKRPNRKK